MNRSILQVERAKVEQAKTERRLYVASTGNHQGLICDEYTGANVAVTYDKEDAPELVRRWNAFPELVAALRHVLQENAIDIDWTMVVETLRKLETK